MVGVDSAGVPRVRSLGRYELFAKLGSGGMAEVHLARQRGLKRFRKLVVVKTVHPQLARDDRFVDLLLDEARISALLKHPRVVDIYDVDEDKGTVFIAMEYLPGQSLNEIIKAGRRGDKLDVLSSARLIADAAEGLDAAHNLRTHSGDELELVHRDVSPGNIVVLYGGEVKLVDFGVAKARDHLSSSAIGKFAGKLGYAAPEQLETDDADRRSDVFSLGVVLWELLCLRRLFPAKTRDEALRLVSSGKAPKPSSLRKEIPSEIDDVCIKALRPDPAERYQSAKEMRDALKAALLAADYRRENDPVAEYMESVFADERADMEALVRRISESTNQISIAELGPEDAATTIDEALPEKIALLEEMAVLSPVTLPAATPPPVGPSFSTRMTAVFRTGHPWRRPLLFGVGAALAIAFIFVLIEFGTSGTTARNADTESSAPVPVSAGATYLDARAAPAAADTNEERGELFAPDARTNDDNASLGDPEADEQEADEQEADEQEVDESAREKKERESKERKAKERKAKEREAKERKAKERKAKEREAKEREAKEREAKEREAKEREAKEREAKEHEAKNEAIKRDGPDTKDNKPVRDRAVAKERYLEGTRAIRRGDMATAKDRLKAAIDADSSYSLAHRGLGVVYQSTGNKSAAVRAYRRYLRLNPKARDAKRIRKTIDELEGK